MRIWFDTEFIENGETIDLLSIGMVREDGREYYAEPLDCKISQACPWVRENVIPHLTGPVKKRGDIARDILVFAGEAPEFWAWFAAYDWVVLCQLYGRMVDLPKGWPMRANDLAQFAEGRRLPEQAGVKHNALEDARWTKLAWEYAVQKNGVLT